MPVGQDQLVDVYQEIPLDISYGDMQMVRSRPRPRCARLHSARARSVCEAVIACAPQKAHAFKGAAANLGIAGLASTAKAVELIAGALGHRAGEEAVLYSPLKSKKVRPRQSHASEPPPRLVQFCAEQEVIALAEQYDAEVLTTRLHTYIACLHRRTELIHAWCVRITVLPRLAASSSARAFCLDMPTPRAAPTLHPCTRSQDGGARETVPSRARGGRQVVRSRTPAVGGFL